MNRFIVFGMILYIMGNELLIARGKTAQTHRHIPFQTFTPPLIPLREIVNSYAVHDAAGLI